MSADAGRAPAYVSAMELAAPHHDLSVIPSRPSLLAPRRAWADDASAIAAHLRRLSPEDRILRFCGGVGETVILRHAAEVGGGSPLGLVSVEAGDGWKVRGLAELAPMGDAAEVAISVEDGWRGQGIAPALLIAAARICVRRRLPTMVAVTLSENRRMRGLGAKLGARSRRVEGELHLVFDAAQVAAMATPARRPGLGFAHMLPRAGWGRAAA